MSARSNELKGIHVLWIILAFFGVMMAVNGVFLYRSITTFPGEEVPKSYLQGVEYNRTLEQHAAQSQLGWTAQIGIIEADSVQLIARIQTASGEPVHGLDVEAQLRLTGQAGSDMDIPMSWQPDGVYAATFDSAPKGRIEVELRARRAHVEEVVFEARKTLLRP